MRTSRLAILLFYIFLGVLAIYNRNLEATILISAVIVWIAVDKDSYKRAGD